ncbi:hypothetical protein [Frondihabitans sp. VKM Ac-2883]|uniref:hypothetical protein n=1 Tax=Frondihabitans sp. VKM Ac-2883 TaxID=2783823 RepID=UPI00188B2B72|nr:hypothetical protein [Frondihabitans sp. VKM Ac-2883]MBF4577762.1 hypothetical protein [Frondihabitans sp. VKM Ac-2883]
MSLTVPLGRPSDVDVDNAQGPFVDHPPFRGLGFTPAGDNVAPVWWLDPVRFPPGAKLWRFHADGRQMRLATYPDVAQGWVPVDGLAVRQDHSLPPSDLLGTMGTWRGNRLLVDLIGEGLAVLGSSVPVPSADFIETRRGVWSKTVPISEIESVSSLRLTAKWRGLDFQVVSRSASGGQIAARIVYVGRNALEAEAVGLQKIDAGFYQAFVPMDELTQTAGVEISRTSVDAS